MHAKNITGIDRTYIVEKQDNSINWRQVLYQGQVLQSSPISNGIIFFMWFMALFSIIISFGYYYKLIFLSHSLSRSLRGGKKTLKINIMPIEIKRLKIENNYYRPHDSDTFYKIQVLPWRLRRSKTIRARLPFLD